MKRLISSILRLLVVLATVDFICLFCYSVASSHIIEKYAINQPVDAVLLFFEGYGEFDGLSEGSYQRVQQAKLLFQNRLARSVVCLGGMRGDGRPNGADLMCRILQAHFIPNSSLIVDKGSWDTLTNWREAQRIIKENGWRRIAVVSSKLHMMRILYLARGNNLVLTMSPHEYENSNSWGYFWRLWRETHHELLAWGAMLFLPDETYQKMMRGYRLGE